MTWSRREVLATLGVASAQAILAACGGAQRPGTRTDSVETTEIRAWLRDAVRVLRGAGFEGVHVLAVRRKRITSWLDVLGGGVARTTSDGVVMTVRDRDGVRREHVTNSLSRDGVAEAARVLAGKTAKPADVDFGTMAALPTVARPDPDVLSDGMLLAKVSAMADADRDDQGQPIVSSRIVYAAALLDLDDAHVWSVAPGRDLEQRRVRIRKSITRVAWNGTRPVVTEAVSAYSGSIDANPLRREDIAKAREDVLALMTPTEFPDGEHELLLEPGIGGALIDEAVRVMLTTSATSRPEVAARLAATNGVSPLITLVDDPKVKEAYGGFDFDDAGVVAQPITLIEKGSIKARLGDGRGQRAGHVGVLEAQPSHLRVTPGGESQIGMLDKGFTLEGLLDVTVDPTSDRVVVSAARARERVNKLETGRVFADVELVGSLTQLLGAVTGLSSEMRSIGFREESFGEPRWRSVETPWIRLKGIVRARRGLT